MHAQQLRFVIRLNISALYQIQQNSEQYTILIHCTFSLFWLLL